MSDLKFIGLPGCNFERWIHPLLNLQNTYDPGAIYD